MLHLLTGIVVGVVLAEIAILVTTVYLHRGLAHRALRVHPVAEFPFRVMIWLMTGMKPREWTAVHRLHHAATDTDQDPHSPLVLGFWRVQLANAALYRRTARDGVTVDRYAKDLQPDWFDRWFFDRAWLGLGTGVVILCLALGWQTGLLAAVVHMTTYLGLSGAINAVGHTYGKQPHDNSATNGRLLALVTAGEGLHNNHHSVPTAARFSRGHAEFDPGWWLARSLAAVHLATIRHETLPVRTR